MPSKKTKEDLGLLRQLIKTFADKQVEIIHTGKKNLCNTSGICKTFVFTETGLEMELSNGSCWGLINPVTITNTSIEGTLPMIEGLRTIKLILPARQNKKEKEDEDN